jgi:hypothetical protein
MSGSETQGSDYRGESTLFRDLGLPGMILLTWVVAGGILAGGFLVGYAGVTERTSGHALFYTAGALYLIGAGAGLVLGGAIGMLGRPARMTVRNAFRDQMTGLLYALPAVVIAFMVAGWIAMTMLAIHLARIGPLIGVSLAYLVGFLLVVVAVRQGWFGTREAWRRFRRGARLLSRLRITVVDE